MKARTTKCGVFVVALAVTLLITAALIASCLEPVNYGSLAREGAELTPFTPPEDMGYFRLNVDVEKFTEARTTLPTTTAYTTVASFNKREVYVSGGDGGTGYNNLNWNGSDPILVGTSATAYSVTVVGYNGDNPTPHAVAAGTGSVTISTTSGGTATVVMKEIKYGEDYAANGTFALALDNTFGATTVTANVIGLSTGATDDYETADTNVSGSNPTFSLAPGYYRMELSVEKAEHAPVVIREVIVIWSGLTTTYSRTLTLNSNVHEVTYTFNDDRDPDDGVPPLTTTKKFDHGDVFTHPASGVPEFLDDTNTVDSSQTFQGWFTAASGGTQVVVGAGAKKILRPETVYAQWLGAGSGNITMSVSVSYSGAKPIAVDLTVGGGSTFSPGTPINLNALPAITFTINAATISSLTNPVYAWHYQDSTSLGAGTSITVDFASDDKYTTQGAHIFNLEVKEDGDDDPSYNAVITITVS